MNDKVLQPITLNYQKFKREYKRLEGMTSYQRAMDVAVERKANAWMDYKPLAKMQLIDDLQPAIVTIRIPIHAGNGVRRSTYRGAVYAQATVIWRPTELQAIARALGFPILDFDLLFERHIPIHEVRYCFACKRTKDISQFAYDSRFPGEHAFWCKNCRIDNVRRAWRVAG